MAAIVGHHMYVHGGFDGTQHLGDVWRLDLQAWHWEQLQPQVWGGARLGLPWAGGLATR